ncbi:MAG: hypothetical protein R6V53_00010 [Candidatus Woesearchaeota archaeon]
MKTYIILMLLFLTACTNEETLVPNELLMESPIQSFQEDSIILEDGSEIKIPANITKTFQETEELREKTETNSTDVVKTYRDRTVIERTTVVEIEDNEEYDEVFGNETPDYNKTNESKTLSETATIEKVQDACRNDRTMPYCDRSEEDLKKLLENKSGTYEILETVNVRKVPLNSLNITLGKTPEILMDPLDVMVPADENETYGFMPLQGMQYIGPSYQKEIFIDGFTEGFELSYEKKFTWNKFGKEVAMAKLFSYIGYGLGLRIPFQTELTIHNNVIDSDPGEFSAKIDLQPLDLDAEGYKEAGLSSFHLFDGKELVLEFGAQAGAKVKLLGHTVYNSNFGKMIDNSKDFTPPLGGERVNLGRLVFEGTDTGLYYGDDDVYVDGDIGITFNLKGEHVNFRCEGLNTVCEDFDITGKKTLDLSLEPVIHDQEDEFGKYANFGITLSNPRYKSKANFGAEFGIEAGVNVPYLGWRTVRTPWVELYEFDIDLPYLGRHDGTPGRLPSVENKAYMNIPTFDNTTLNLLGGPLALNITSRCQKLHDIVTEGAEVPLDDEEINIYTTFGDAIGSVTIDDGFIADVDCYHIHNEPSYELEMDNYGVLTEFDNGDPYTKGLELMDQDRLKLKGIGTANRFKSFLGNNFAGLTGGII